MYKACSLFSGDHIKLGLVRKSLLEKVVYLFFLTAQQITINIVT